MKPILIAGTIIVNVALLFYTLFIFSERRYGKGGSKVLFFLTSGVLFDATATICMIAGSSNSPFTLHGILGYSALAGMITDAVLYWRNRVAMGPDAPVSQGVHLYTLIIYCWWVTAYVTGALLVLVR